MKKLLCVIAAICLVSFVAGSAMADSAKFAATYDRDTEFVEATWAGVENEPVVDLLAEQELATLHVANWKEILMGVSGQVNLVTLTEAKAISKAGVSTAKAAGTVLTGVIVVPTGTTDVTCESAWEAWRELLAYPEAYPEWEDCIAGCDGDASCEEECGDAPAEGENLFVAPGPVTFASRMQELSVIYNDSTGEPEDYVMVGLTLDTTAAHHFNFVADDLVQGTYDVIACYDLTALAEANNVGNSAYAYAGIGPRILTVQEVRATKDGIIDETDSAL